VDRHRDDHNERGLNVAVFTGSATIDHAAPMPDQNLADFTKHRADMQQRG
jgi:hypothetical protein